MFASAGIDANSSAEYPNASATARTPGMVGGQAAGGDRSVLGLHRFLNVVRHVSSFTKICQKFLDLPLYESRTSRNFSGGMLLGVRDVPVQPLLREHQRALVAASHRHGGVELLVR